MPTTDDECVSYARDCVRLSELTKDEYIREQLLNMAREWMAQAMHEPKMPKPKSLRTQGASVGGLVFFIAFVKLRLLLCLIQQQLHKRCHYLRARYRHFGREG